MKKSSRRTGAAESAETSESALILLILSEHELLLNH